MSRKTQLNSTTAIAYIRVSTDKKRQELGLEAQKAQIEAYAARKGLQVAQWFSDEASGGAELNERPGLIGALRALKDHRAAVLIVAKRDRFTRDALITAPVEVALRKMGAQLVSADGVANDSSPTAQLLRGILDSVGQFERTIIQGRIKAALQVKRGRGERISRHAPYGFRLAGEKDRRLEPNPAEQNILAEARTLRSAGLTLRAVQESLASRGMVNRAGQPFALPALHKMTR